MLDTVKEKTESLKLAEKNNEHIRKLQDALNQAL